MNIAFAGFRHSHIFDLWNRAENNAQVHISGSWEGDAASRTVCAARGIEFVYPDFEDILNDTAVDAVAIGDYYGVRGSLALKALSAGKHVIADKPLCTSLDELDRIEALSKEKSLSVFCMYSMRYEANAAAVRKIISEGRIGEVRSVYFGGQHPLNAGTRPSWYFEKGKHGGTINDIGVHGIDFLRYTAGLRFEKINAARCWNAFAKDHPDFRDSAQFMLEMQNGAGVIADVSYAAPDSFSYSLPVYWLFMIWCSEGMLKFNAGSGPVEAYFRGADSVEHIRGTAQKDDYLTDLMTEIKGGRPKILSTAEVLASARDTLAIQNFADKFRP